MCSDGVHDNTDPQMLGKMPREFGLPYDTWEESEMMNVAAAFDAKAKFATRYIRDLILPRNPDENFRVTPEMVTDKLVQHCIRTTKDSRDFMEQNPGTKQPEDYRKYPGKMDHTTCVSYRIGSFNHSAASSMRPPNVRGAMQKK